MFRFLRIAAFAEFRGAKNAAPVNSVIFFIEELCASAVDHRAPRKAWPTQLPPQSSKAQLHRREVQTVPFFNSLLLS
jgi:hypothetical protein